MPLNFIPTREKNKDVHALCNYSNINWNVVTQFNALFYQIVTTACAILLNFLQLFSFISGIS
jgi:hypothetical protein